MTVRRVVIADDEPLARERIGTMLAGRPTYEVVAECQDGVATVEAILALDPAIVFLDVKMPGLDGFEVLTALTEVRVPPAVIFVTAFETFGAKAFDVSAVDYLLKPFDVGRFDLALARAEQRLSGGGLDPELRRFLERLRAHQAFPERFLVRGPHHLYFVPAAEIGWVDAQANYVRVHVGGRTHLIRDTMKAFAAKLDPDRFIRVHRSIMVNINHVQRLEPQGHGEYLITMRDGSRLASSRSHSARLHALLR